MGQRGSKISDENLVSRNKKYTKWNCRFQENNLRWKFSLMSTRQILIIIPFAQREKLPSL
jgi:hypothetical protein